MPRVFKPYNASTDLRTQHPGRSNDSSRAWPATTVVLAGAALGRSGYASGTMAGLLERRLATILGVTAAIAWLLFELYAGLRPASDAVDCGCDAGESPAELVGAPIDDPAPGDPE